MPIIGPQEPRGTKKVLLLSSSSGSRGGGEFYLRGLAQGLVQFGYDVHSAMSNHPRMDELAESLAQFGPVHRLDYRNTYDRRLRSLGAVAARHDIHRISGWLRALQPDVIHLNKQNLEDGLDLLAAAERTGIATVATIHVTRTMHQLRSLGGSVRDWVANRTLHWTRVPIVVIARSGLTDLEQAGIEPERLHLVWNGVSAAPDGDRDSTRRAWGVSPEHLVLGCVARIEPQKNPLFVVPLLAQLPESVRIVWIGDGSLRESLQREAQQHGVADRLVLPGWQAEARRSLAGFDAFLLPSLYEGFPLAILEAMAAGLPVIASDVDGVAEAVRDGETGFVCPPDATATWLDRIRIYHDDPDARRRAGAAGLKRYRQEFTLETMAGRTAAVYEKAMTRAGDEHAAESVLV